MELVVPRDLKFHPQATAGVGLESLSRLIDLLAGAKVRGQGKGKAKGKAKGKGKEQAQEETIEAFLSERANAIGWSQLREQVPFRETTREAQQDMEAYFKDPSERLRGFVHLLATIVRGFGVPYAHPDPPLKYFMPLMPRTALMAVYHHLLSEQDRASFQEGVTEWIAKEPLLAHSIPAAVDWTPPAPVRIGHWLQTLASGGEDLLKQADSYGEIEIDSQNAYWQVSNPTDIGPDEQSEQSRQGIILELRHLGANVTSDEIPEFALGVFDVVRGVHRERRAAGASVEAMDLSQMEEPQMEGPQMELSQAEEPSLLAVGRKRPPHPQDEDSMAKRSESIASEPPLPDGLARQQLALELVFSGYGIKATARLLGLSANALSAAYGVFAQGAEEAKGAGEVPTPEGFADRLRGQGVQPARITAFLSEPRRRRVRQYSPEFREAIVYLVKQFEYDYSHTQIVNALGIPRQTITAWCNNTSISPGDKFDWARSLRKEGIPEKTIEKLENRDIPPGKLRIRYSPAYKAAIVALVQQYNYKPFQIAKALNIPHITITSWCNDTSVPSAQKLDWATIDEALRQEGIDDETIQKLKNRDIALDQRKTYSPNFKEAIVYLIRHCGYGKSQIVEALGILLPTVASWCRDTSISPSEEFDWEPILRQEKVPEETIKQLKAGTIAPVQKKKYSLVFKEAVVALIRHCGYGKSQIAQVLNILLPTVSDWCKDTSIAPGKEVDWEPILRQEKVPEETIKQLKARTLAPAQRKTYSHAYKAAIVSLVRHYHYHQAQIAQVLNIPEKTVSNWCKDTSIAPGKEVDWEPILRQEKVPEETIKQLKARTLPPVQKRKYSLAFKEAIVSLVRHYHYSQPQIAEALRISKKTVETWSYNKSICTSPLPWQRIEVTLREEGIEQNWIDELSKMTPAHSSRVQSAS